MAGQIPEGKILEIKSKIDLVSLVSRYVDLKKTGNQIQGLCPMHEEKTPSFSVNAERQTYQCFGCNAGGDAFSFVRAMEGLSFPEAVKKLAVEAGVALDERKLAPEEQKRQNERKKFHRANSLAAEYFQQNLIKNPEGQACREYLTKRGYNNQIAKNFGLGFALKGWQGLAEFLKSKGVKPEVSNALGLTRQRKQGNGNFDLFRDRLIFPIHDVEGNVVAFGGRVIGVDPKVTPPPPKYINSQESSAYHKGSTLFGFHAARQAIRQEGEVIFVEGYTDLLAAHKAGINNVVATCGTALTPDHARMIKRYADRVLVLFDQDVAGRQATFRSMPILQAEGLTVEITTLPAGDDPDSYLRSHGAELFRERLDESRPAMDVFIEETFNAAGTGVEQKLKAVETILEKISNLNNDIHQDFYLQNLSQVSGVDPTLLKNGLNKLMGLAPVQDTSLLPSAAPVLKEIWTVEIDGHTQNMSTGETLKEAVLAMAHEWRSWCETSGEDLSIMIVDGGSNLRINRMVVGKAYIYEVGEPNSVFESDLMAVLPEVESVLGLTCSPAVKDLFKESGYELWPTGDGCSAYGRILSLGMGDQAYITANGEVPKTEDDPCTIVFDDLFGRNIEVGYEFTPDRAIKVVDFLSAHFQINGWPAQDEIDSPTMRLVLDHLDGPEAIYFPNIPDKQELSAPSM